MLRATLREISTAPVASLGALSGIASFVVVLLGPTTTLEVAPASVHSASAAFAFVKLALVIPGVAFFFAFLSYLFFRGGMIRGAFATALFLLLSAVLAAAASAITLDPFQVHGLGREPTVLGFTTMVMAFIIVLGNVLVFGGVIGESVYAYFKERADEAAPEEGDQTDPIFWMMGLMFGAILLLGIAMVAEVVLNAALGLL